jgi:hypothetical protein
MLGKRLVVVAGVAAALIAFPMARLARAASSEPAFPYVDVNDNGKYDAAVDSGDASAVLTDGLFRTANLANTDGTPGVVIPAGVSLIGENIDIEAAGDVTVLGCIHADGALSLRSTFGSVVFGPGACATAEGMLDLAAHDDVKLGKGASLYVPGNFGWSDITLDAHNGNVVVAEKAKVQAANHLYIGTQWNGLGHVTIGRGVKLSGELTQLSAGGGVQMRKAVATLGIMQVSTPNGDIDMRDSKIKAINAGNGRLLVSAPGHLVDLRGMKCPGVPERNMQAVAAKVLY